jgi:hypothetical protein
MFFSLNLEKTKKNRVNGPITAPPWPIYSIFYGLFPRITQKSHSKTLDYQSYHASMQNKKKLQRLSPDLFIIITIFTQFIYNNKNK